MDRREFLGLVGVGGVVSCLPATIAACTPQSQSSTPAGTPRADGFLAVGTVAELTQNGQLSAKDAAGNPVLVIRNPTNAEAIVAVNPTCTHAGCAVSWAADQQDFACPCHGSKFAADGKVLQGPATAPLATYTAKVEGDTILVKQS